MKKALNEDTLTKIIESKYPTKIKVAEIMELYTLDRMNLLNQVANQIGKVIDKSKQL